jgi:pyruvate dehydrogenase E2 component (dihydrolipoamide acetyltransferase)
MATFELKLPDIGEGVQEGEIVKWLVKPGDVVKEDQVVVEVMTDKATVSVPTPRGGKVLQTFGKEGEVAKVHHLLVTLEVDGAVAPAAPAPGHGAVPVPASAAAAAVNTVAAPARAANEKVLATPVTRRMAREHGLDLSTIAGSGPQGRITKADVEAALAHPGNSAVATGPAVPARAPAAPLQSSAVDQRIPLKGLRKKIAEKMVRSKFTAPHYTFVEEVDASSLVAFRNRINAQLAAGGDKTKVSFLPFFCKAVAAAMRKFPQVNANFDDATQELVVRGELNFGIAAATEEGLTVPVVHGVDRLSIKGLAAEVSRLADAARNRRLRMEELSGGTFTITSLGQTGGLFATPVINYPEVAIMGVHRMRKRPVVVDDQVVIREVMYLSFSFDHRVIDGAVGAEFAYAVIRLLETPELMFVDMV